uniref:SH3 domain-containing protein n=1 Tax=Geobacter metallireducens TaxID=28232 RepID=A0A831UBC1_GEOME
MNRHQTTTRSARMALVLSLLLTAACATVNTAPVEEKAGPQAPGAGFETEPLPPAAAPDIAPAPTVTPQASVTVTTISQTPGRITPRRKYVNVRPAPSAANRPVAVLMGGKKVEVLDRKEEWVKIRWTRGKKVLEGWVAEKFVETEGLNP